METNFTPHKEILEILVDVFELFRNPSNVKTMMLEANSDIDEVHWFGLPIIFKELFTELSEESTDPKLQGATIRLIAPFYPKKALTMAGELETCIKDLSQWNYDRAIGLAFAAEGILQTKDEEKSKRFLNKALNYAYDIPDRSDRSIALCEMLPIMHKVGMTAEIPEAFDKIVYEPKKLEASEVLATIEDLDEGLLKTVLTSLSPEKKRLVYGIRAKILSKKDQEKAKKLCTKALDNTGNGVDAATTKKEVFEAYQNIGEGKKANQILEELSNTLFDNINERPYASILIDLINSLVSNGPQEKGISMLGRVREQTENMSSLNRLFILKEIAKLLAEHQFFEESLRAYHTALKILGSLDELSMSSSVMSVGVSILNTLNNFPQAFPQAEINKIISKIKAKEKTTIQVSLTQDNIEFLDTIKVDTTTDEKIDNLILNERKKRRLDIEEKLMNLINKLSRRKPRITVTFLLKHVNDITIPESERSNLLSMLSKAGNELAKDNPKRAESYINLTIDKLKDLEVPLSPVVINMVDQYLLRLF